MPFAKGNKFGHGRPKSDSPKTIWLLQALAANGVNLQDLLAKSILKAAKGDREAMDFAHLLTKLLPMVTNAPKNDMQVNSIETLVINRYDSKSLHSRTEDDTLVNQIETVIDTEGIPPSLEVEGTSEVDKI